MEKQHQKIIDEIAAEVKLILEGEGSGHDWWHVLRVWKMAKNIGAGEKADMFIVELAAILHDISDWKFNHGDDSVGPRIAGEIMSKYGVSDRVIKEVREIIADLSFKGAKVKTEMKTREGEVVQDADRLDAMGAIGVGRTFAYGGHTGRVMHDPKVKPVAHTSKGEYFENKSPIINHFYEKLLLLKDRMNTKTGKQLAEGRHDFMEKFLERFYREWEGKA